ncbi:MAG: hypothetical protein Q4F65_09725, partial [Propionibacteriaceae bacterium]|nr:hypothetical protein [Propionibacteriaceae bacterium]
ELGWHELGSVAGRPVGLAGLWDARHGVRHTTDAAVAAAQHEAPSPTRARTRGLLLAAAQASDRDHVADWSSFTVRDLPSPDGRTPVPVRLEWPDPFGTGEPEAFALAHRMRTEPRVRALGGFVPPPG